MDNKPSLIPDWKDIGDPITNFDDLKINNEYWIIDKNFGNGNDAYAYRGTLKEKSTSEGFKKLILNPIITFDINRNEENSVPRNKIRDIDMLFNFDFQNIFKVKLPQYLTNEPNTRHLRRRKLRKNTRTRRLKKHRLC